MRAGDWLLIVVIGASLAALGLDQVTDGALQAWIASNLPTRAAQIGQLLGWIAYGLSPLLALPLVSALIGRFAGLPEPLERLLQAATRWIDTISTATGDAVRWAALALVLVTATIVIQRYVFGASSTKLQESVIYLHSLLFLLSAAATLLSNGHVRVDILYSKMSDRAKAWTDLVGYYLALLPMSWLILDTTRSYVGGSWRILERSRESDGLPLIFLLKTAIPVFAILLILQGAAMAARAALTISGRTAPPLAAATDREL